MTAKAIREKVGSFWTDTGTVLLGDPCHFIPDDDGSGVPPVRYLALMESFRGDPIEPEVITAPDGRRHEFARFGPEKPAVTVGSAGLAVRVGCDGWCHVYAERDESGVDRLIIEVGRTEP